MSGDRLDEQTEEAMLELIRAGLSHGYVEKLAIADCDRCQEPLVALRQRIRELIVEAKYDTMESDVASSFAKPSHHSESGR